MKDPIQYIKNLDLEYLVRRMVEKQKWDLPEAEEAVRKYKNFLILRCLNPKLAVVPTPEIDEVWHDHILHTKSYIRDCDYIFGEYFHHKPSPETKEGQEFLEEKYIKTMRAYEKLFQQNYAYALDIARW